MSWDFSVYLLPSLLAGAVAVIVAALAWGHRSERTARPFVVLMLALAWWALAYGIELGYADPSRLLLWDEIAFVGSVTVPAAMFWLAVEYAGLDDSLPSWTPAILVVEPVVTLALLWTYPASRLVWASVGVERSGALVLPVFHFGPWYWVNYAYSYLLIGAALVAISYVFVRGTRISRRQSTLLVLGAVIPLGANLLYNLFPTLSPFPAVDLTTFALTITGSLYGLALFRFKMLDLAPATRGVLLSEVGDGFVVVDAEGVLVEGNEVGRRVVEREDDRFGVRPITHERLAALDGRIVSVTVDGVERAYELHTEPITDFREERVATLVVFRDITELEVIRQQEQRLSVMNRVLRHNIRNEMNVIGGLGDILADSLSGEERAHAEAISRAAVRMTSIGEKARHVSTDLDASGKRQSVDVVPLVESAVERASEGTSSVTVARTGCVSARAMVAAESDLETAVEYLVENAIQHSDSDEPAVAVEVGTTGDDVDIAVRDDGPGIPPVEREVLESGSETPLEHGSGLGLWIVYWLISQSDGHLSFEANEPRGSVVTIRLPAGE